MLSTHPSITVDEPGINQQSINSSSADNNGLADGLKINEDVPKKMVLKRNLGLFSGISFIIQIILGKCIEN